MKGDKNNMCMIICIFIHIDIIISIKYVDIHDHNMLFLPKHRRQMTRCDVFVGGMVIPNVEELFGVECFVDVRDGSFDSAASNWGRSVEETSHQLAGGYQLLSLKTCANPV